MSVTDWSPQPGGNALADRAIPARDGMAGREFPEAIRGLMAKAAALALDQGGALVTTGFNNVYEVATNSSFTEIKPGVSLSFWADRDNTAEPYLNVDGTGPRRWLSADGLALPAGAIQGGLLYTVAWNAALPGSAPAWRMVGSATGSAGTGLTGFDFSGAFAERAQYDAQPKGKVFLAIADTPTGASWTLYIKRSDGFGDWSNGLPMKASPAQSTADAQAAAERAVAQVSLAEQAGAEQVRLAQEKAQLAGDQAASSANARSASEAARDAATLQAATADTRATEAAIFAANAAAYAAQVGRVIFDFNFDSDSAPSNDWNS
jgi:hypothetical protein